MDEQESGYELPKQSPETCSEDRCKGNNKYQIVSKISDLEARRTRDTFLLDLFSID